MVKCFKWALQYTLLLTAETIIKLAKYKQNYGLYLHSITEMIVCAFKKPVMKFEENTGFLSLHILKTILELKF